MTEITSVVVVLGAVFCGVLCTLLVQWAAAIRSLSREVSTASQRAAELMSTLLPSARRLDRLSQLAEGSEEDVRLLQNSLHRFAASSAELTDGIQRVSGWIAVVTPFAVAALDRFMRERSQGQDAPANEARKVSRSERGPDRGASGDHAGVA